ncbi:transcriptional regulatory protein CpxR [Escherichia coli]|uniref:Transcriptional regulatory protein CpxR n=1 Tax=Escherichia coli TaxID=562 RepID=A0A376LGG0_ECOLX|nr:transcriptional regulatory protein CpxR [Escherichia coli]
MNKILLVDDDRELTSLLKELLEMEGFNVIVAHDGEQALDLLDDSIDLLLLDVMMPKKKWYRHIKSTSPDTPDACHYVDGARQ